MDRGPLAQRVLEGDNLVSDTMIRLAQEGAVARFSAEPGLAFGTASAVGSLEEGLVCRVASGPLEVVMDMPQSLGGEASAPGPGYIVRAGLIGCIAIGIKMTAVREGMSTDRITVRIDMDFDDSALLAMGRNSAAPLETRIAIEVESTAARAAVEAMVARALAADPYFRALRDPQKVAVAVTTTAR